MSGEVNRSLPSLPVGQGGAAGRVHIVEDRTRVNSHGQGNDVSSQELLGKEAFLLRESVSESKIVENHLINSLPLGSPLRRSALYLEQI